MALKKVGVELEAQQSAVFLKALDNANAAVANFGTAAIKASTGVNKFDTSTRQLKIDDLERKLQGQAQALALLERELDQTAAKYGESSIQADKKRLAIGNLNRSISSNEQALEAQKTALNNAIQAEIRAEQAIQNVGTETAQATAKINKLGTEVLQSAQQSERGFKDIGRAAETAASQVGGWEQIVIGGLRRVGEAAIDLSIQGGRALIGLIGDTLSAAGDFEATLNNFSSKTGSAMEEAGFSLQDFSAEFLRLGAETKFSAAEAGDAAVELAKGGVSVTDIMGEATAATLDLAAAADLELAPAAEIVAKQLGVWADQGVTATDVVDNLAQAANASEVDVDELALGLANVGGVAKAAGLSFEETVTALALIAPGFSSSADAGTSFKTMLAALQPSSASSAEAMQQLGLFTEETGSAFYDAMGEFVGLEEMTRLLTEATKDLNTEDKSRLLRLAFGSDAQRAALGIIDATTDGLHQQIAAMDGAGSAAEQAAKMNVGYNAAMDALGGSLDTVQIILGTLLLPTLTAFVETAVIPAVNAVGDFATALGASNDPMGMIVEQLKLGASMLSTWVIDAIPSVIGGLATLGAALIEWVVSMLPTWGAAMLELGQQAVQWIGDSLPGWQAAAAEYLSGLIAWVQASLPGWIENLKTLGAAAAQWIADSMPGWLAKANELFNAMITWITASAPGWIESLKQFANAAIQWVLDSLPGLGTNLGIFAGEILAWVVRTTGELIPVIAGLALKFVSWVWTDVIPALPGALDKIYAAINNFLTETITRIVPELVKLAEKFYTWVNDVVMVKLSGELEKIWIAISSWIATTATNAYNAVIAIGTNIIEGITKGVTDAAQGLINTVVGAVEDTFNAVTDFLLMRSPSKLYQGVGENIMRGMTEGVEKLRALPAFAIIETMTVTAEAAKLIAMSSGIAAGSTFAENMANAIRAKLDTSAVDMQAAITGALRRLQPTAIGEAASGGLVAGDSFVKKFNDAISGLSPDVAQLSMQAGVDAALKKLKPPAINEAAFGGDQTGKSFADHFQQAIDGAFNTTIQAKIHDALAMLAGLSGQGGWAAGNAFASAYQSAISGLVGGGSLIDMPSLSGGFSSGASSTTNNSANYAINYNGVSSPPPSSQSFAALAAWAG